MSTSLGQPVGEPTKEPAERPDLQPESPARVPRLGFCGLGWIGRHRMEALLKSGAGEVAAIADTSPHRVADAARLAPASRRLDSLDALLEQDLDGIVIATPSALHAEQSIRALERGHAVFSQKPLARTATESRAVIAAARKADRLLGVDLSYRYTAALRAVRDTVQSGSIGTVYAVDLVFLNAYGPDAGWARDPALAGGGCVIDLGVHLVDMVLWTMGFPAVKSVNSRLFSRGEPVPPGQYDVCEDYAVATLELAGGAVVRLSCAWESSTGHDAIIEARFTGSMGAVALRNVYGSFYDFIAELYQGTSARTLAVPPDAWGGRALIDWTRRLAANPGFDPEIESVAVVAETLDAILGR